MEAACRISSLIFKYLKNTLTAEEQLQLTQWKDANPENRMLFDALTNTGQLNEQLNELYRIEATKKQVHKQLKRRLFKGRSKFLQLTNWLWSYQIKGLRRVPTSSDKSARRAVAQSCKDLIKCPSRDFSG